MASDAREVIARAIAKHRGWYWDVMPSFADTFTNGCSHEECRATADAILAALASAGLAVVPRDAATDALELAEFAIALKYPPPDRKRYPTIAQRYDRDMEPLRRMRAALDATETRDG